LIYYINIVLIKVHELINLTDWINDLI